MNYFSDFWNRLLDATTGSLKTSIVDGSGSQITSFGGGTQYTEGDTDASITGTAVMWEDGSNTLRPASAAKPLPVEIIAGAGSGGTAAADDADFTAGTTNGTPAQGVYESTPTSVTDGDLGTVGITAARRLKTSATIDAALPAGTNAIGKLAANSGVDIGDVDVASIAAGDNNIGNVDVASFTPGTYAVDDSAMPATPQTVPVSGEYRSSATTYTDGDVTVLQTDINGNLKTTLATGLSSTEDTVGVRPDDYATDDSAMPATPRVVPVGGEARDTANSYADGDAVVQQFNRAGALVNAGLDNFYVTKCAPSAFDGATTNARGDEGGTSDPFTLFTVTGDVLIGVYGVCTTDLVGSGTVSVGPTGNATLMLAALAATSIDQNEVWMDATPAIGKPIDSLNYYVVGNGVDIVEDIATDTVTAGNIYYVALWKPLTPGSNVVSAV